MTDFYREKKVLITGHTGFKGTWLTKILADASAEVLGYSRCSEKEPSLFELSGVKKQIRHTKGYIEDYENLRNTFQEFQPEIIFHLAAQPIVRDSYINPLETYRTNVMGTANVLECIRKTESVHSAVIITTDKVYRNDEKGRAFCESDVMDGFDPYSNSKSCAEMVTASYKRSFPGLPPISTARAGNVIGGGDFAKDRIIPDCVRAVRRKKPILIRNPYSIRPYQHVLEPLFAYLLIAEKQWDTPTLAGSYNIGPKYCDCVTTGEIVSLFCEKWGDGASWINAGEMNAPHEANFLKLDCGLVERTFGWQPRWDVKQAVDMTTRFYKAWIKGENLVSEMEREIEAYQI